MLELVRWQSEQVNNAGTDFLGTSCHRSGMPFANATNFSNNRMAAGNIQDNATVVTDGQCRYRSAMLKLFEQFSHRVWHQSQCGRQFVFWVHRELINPIAICFWLAPMLQHVYAGEQVNFNRSWQWAMIIVTWRPDTVSYRWLR